MVRCCKDPFKQGKVDEEPLKRNVRKDTNLQSAVKPLQCFTNAVIYPLIPVTRKCRLPLIFVQLMKLSMLRASTVCLVDVPVPRQAGWRHEEERKSREATTRSRSSVSFGDGVFSRTFRTQASAGLAFLHSVLLHLLLIRGAVTHARAAIHHEVRCKRNKA